MFTGRPETGDPGTGERGGFSFRNQKREEAKNQGGSFKFNPL
jgi:hypothetical protein